MNKPKCFGTKEFYKNNSICRNCHFYIECKKVAPVRPPIKASMSRIDKFLKGDK